MRESERGGGAGKRLRGEVKEEGWLGVEWWGIKNARKAFGGAITIEGVVVKVAGGGADQRAEIVP